MFDERDTVCYFINAHDVGRTDPMRRGNDKPLDGIKGAERYSGTIHYYWYHFFRLHLRYGRKSRSPDSKAAQVEADFAVDQSDGFEEWWNATGRWLFGDKYETESRASHIVTREQFGNLTEGVALFFPIDGNLKLMLKDAEHAFKEAREFYYQSHSEMRKKYSLSTRRYELRKLHNKLRIYPAVMDNPTESYVSIFERLKEQLSLDTVHSKMDGTKAYDFMRENFDQACRLVYHVARGKFPDFTAPQGAYNPREQRKKFR